MDSIKVIIQELQSVNARIYVEGDNLRIDADRGAINDRLKLLIKTHKEGLLTYVSRLRQDGTGSIPKATPRSDYPLSSSQRRLWVLSQLEGGNVAYNMPGIYVFEGPLDRTALEQAFATAIDRYEILRTVFREDEQGEIRQCIKTPEESGFSIRYRDLSEEEAEKEKRLKTLVDAEVSEPFDLIRGPLLRASLIRMDDDKWVFVYTMHHIISDGWSMDILISELLGSYVACKRGMKDTRLPLRIQYKDYAVWQQEQLRNGAFSAHQSYWSNQLGGQLPVLELPADCPRPAKRTFRGELITRAIDKKITQQLRYLAREKGGTLFMGLLAGINALLYKYTGQTDIIAGSPIAGREHADLEDQIGFYVNTLALRTQFGEDFTYMDLLEQVRAVTLAAYERQAYPFDELVNVLPLKWDMSRNALFDIMVDLQNADNERLEGRELEGLTVTRYEGWKETISKFDLAFTFIETGEELEANIGYDSDIYDRSTIERMGDHLVRLLQEITTSPLRAISQLEYITEEERDRILDTFNDTPAAAPVSQLLLSRLDEHAVNITDNTAVIFGERRLTYGQLNEQSNQLAHFLTDHCDIRRGDLIGVLLERSEKLVIAILGIWKIGGVYVPIDPDYPKERIDYMVEDSKCRAVIDDDWFCEFVKRQPACQKENVRAKGGSDDLAYVIYTSGSTGMPKGVAIGHDCLDHFFDQVIHDIGSAPIVQPFIASHAFDISLFQLFTPLLTGGSSLIISPEQFRDISCLVDLLNDVTVIDTVPAVYNLLTAYILDQDLASSFHHIERIFIGGDLIQDSLLQKLSKAFPSAIVTVTYGPTEGTIFCTQLTYGPGAITPESRGSIIGRPINRMHTYILDAQQRPTAIGIAGEIYMAGPGVAKGYVNQPELTAVKFAGNPFKPGEGMYRTGDLGRWLPDGHIEFTGRRDEQVKIRGYRIELEEIDRALQSYPGILSSVAVARPGPNGEKELIACIVSTETIVPSAIRAHVSKILPAYMVPAGFMQLEALPLTPHGKIDRKSILDRVDLVPLASADYIAPRNETEQQLVLVWQDILGKDPISVKDNFFELGGHSLRATRLASQIHRIFQVRIPLKDLFAVAVLEDQARLIGQTGRSSFSPIQPLPVQSYYPLSSSQRRLWVLSQFEEANIAYNMPGVYVFEGVLDRDALDHAFASLIERHESLRTVFGEDEDGEVRQFIKTPEEVAFSVAYRDLRLWPAAEVHRVVREESLRPFDLSAGPLLRAGVIQVEDDKWVFTWTLHHIISDGWSMDIFIHELLLFYKTGISGEANPLLPLRIQYKDYSAWQLDQLKSEAMQVHKDYWLNRFQGELPLFDLTADKARPPVQTYNGGRVHRVISPELTRGLETLSQLEGGTLFMGLLAAVNALLFKYTGQTDIIMGSPIAGRQHADLEGQIGFYVNTLLLRTQFSGTDSFRDLLKNIRQVTLAAYEHQDYPFDELVEVLSVQRDMSRNALFDVMLVYQNVGINDTREEDAPEGLNVSKYEEAETLTSKFDLLFSFIKIGGELNISINYNSDIYYQSTIERLADHFGQLLENVMRHSGQSIRQVPLLNDAETYQLLSTFNDTACPFPEGSTIVDLFEEQVRRTPGHIAVSSEEKGLTYRELDELSNRLGRYLKARYAAGPDEIIGIQLERSDRFIVSVLGVLKSGAAYLPIDPDYPAERITFLQQDSHCLVTIDAHLYDTFWQTKEQYPSQPLSERAAPENLVYLIYTSGSTGTPKGIMMPHRSMVNLMNFHLHQFPGEEVRSVLLFASISFDASFHEIFSTLLRGATLHPIAEETKKEVRGLTDFIVQRRIDTLFLPTAYFRLLSEEEYFMTHIGSTIRNLIIAGEQLVVAESFIDYLRGENIEVHNYYGPAETHVVTTFRSGRGSQLRLERIPPIGKPIDNTWIYILDEQQMLVPVGAIGEICIGGAGLAKGYLDRDPLTRERFIADPFKEGERIYRTGDLGKWQENGEIAYIGRRDFQVKIRGFRVELGEVEHVLQQYGPVDNVLVIARQETTGEKSLVAYVTGKEELEMAALRTYMAGRLPQYMLPSHYVQLERLPITTNGKIDRSKLPDPAGLETETIYIAPRNEAEQQLVLIWQEILGRQRVGIRDNFFELGGHSLKATRLASRVHKVLQVKIALKDLFIHPVLEDQARLIGQAVRSSFSPIQPLPVQSYYPLSSSQRRLWVLSQFEEANIAYNMPGVYVFEGVLDRDALDHAFASLIERHESLRTVFGEDEDGEVRQFIKTPEEAGVTITYRDLREEQHLQEIVRQELLQSLNLSSGPLLRAILYRVEADKWVFAYSLHHIISDGWSMNILIHELLLFYNGYVREERLTLAPLRIQYKDYASWQQEQLQQGAFQAHKEYWLQQFEGEIPILELPVDRPRPAVKTYNGATVSIHIGQGLTEGIKALSQEEGTTLFMGLMALLNVLLFKYTHQKDIVIGRVVAGREHADLEDQIGFYVNTLALRTKFTEDDTYRTLLKTVRKVALGGYEHQAYPFDALVDALDNIFNTSRSPLFDVMMELRDNYIERDASLQKLDNIRVGAYKESLPAISKFDLTFFFGESASGLDLLIEYNCDIYVKETIERMALHMERLLQSILKTPDIPISLLEYVSDGERDTLLFEFNNTVAGYPAGTTVLDMFEEQVKNAPDTAAVLFEKEYLSYRQLDEKSNQLANYLRQSCKIQAGDMIGIMLDRSERMIISILGILKSGGVYVPIDPGYPPARKSFIIKDTGINLLITQIDFTYDLEYFTGDIFAIDVQLDVLDTPAERPEIPLLTDSVAYVIYTSGSTGAPKGCAITHHNLFNYIYWANNYYFKGAGKPCFGLFTSLSFDLTVTSIFCCLTQGGRLTVYRQEEEIQDILRHSFSEDSGIDSFKLTPSHINLLEDLRVNGHNIVRAIVGGEEVTGRHIQLLKQVNPAIEIYNEYGPTETTVGCVVAQLQPGIPVLIGKPVANTAIYVLDGGGRLCGTGIAGELYISGEGVGQGYLNNVELTAARFIADPFREGWRMYRTGDLGRWLPEGQLEFMGRKDQQIKIRGYRIEPEEIEAVMQRHPAIREALVLTKKDAEGNNDLLAFYTYQSEAGALSGKITGNRKRGLPEGARLYELAGNISLYAYNKTELEFVYEEVFVDRCYTKNGLVIPAGGCIVDIGANIGMFSVFAALQHADLDIYSFEPLPPTFELLKLNTTLYSERIKIFNIGISDREETVDFTYFPNATVLSSRYSEGTDITDIVRQTIHNQEKATGQQASESEINELLKDRLVTRTYPCKLMTLSQIIRDHHIERIDYLKIDVEKSEMDVLNGIAEEDWKKIRQIALEIHDIDGRKEQMLKELSRHGFHTYVSQGTYLDGTNLYDVYAISEDTLLYPYPVTETRATNGQSREDAGTIRSSIERLLKTQLPSYMIPHHIIPIDQFPLTANGKVDKAVLLALDDGNEGGVMTYSPPRNATEEKLVSIWQDILGKENIGIKDNFFELGGHSVKAIRLIAYIKREFDIDHSLDRLFTNPTIEDIAAEIEKVNWVNADLFETDKLDNAETFSI